MNFFQSQRNRDVKFRYLGTGHIASQFPNKRVMILTDNGDIETKSDEDSDFMPPLEDATNVEYIVEANALVTR